MSILSLGATLTAVSTDQVSSRQLSNPLTTTADKILTSFLSAFMALIKIAARRTRKMICWLWAVPLIKWNPAITEIPLRVTIEDRDYEIFDMPHGAIRLLDYASRDSKEEFDNVSLSSIRDMIFFDLMTQPDFANDMENRIYKKIHYACRFCRHQARAGKRLWRGLQEYDSCLTTAWITPPPPISAAS